MSTPAMGVSSNKRIIAIAACLSILGTAEVGAAEDVFLIAPRPDLQIPASFFGQHVHHLVFRGLPQDPPRPTPWPEQQIGALRLWDSAIRWAELEPQPGRWRFERMDFYVAEAERRGVPVLYTLGSTPRWASSRPDEPCSYGFGCAAEPADPSHWDRYIAQVARRYKGRIRHYEVWNEPHPGEVFAGHRGFFTGSMNTLIELSRRARATLEQEDAQAVLLTPGFVNRLPVLEEYLARGGAGIVQGLSYHFYSRDDRDLIEKVRAVQALRKRYGLESKPFFNTESGYEGFEGAPLPGYAARDRETAAAMNARAWLLGAFIGLDRWYHHGWDSTETGMVRPDGSMTPAEAAWRRVRGWLIGATPMGCQATDRNLVTCRLVRAGQTGWIAWRPEPGPPGEWRLPGGFEPAAAEDALTGPLQPGRFSVPPRQIAVGASPVIVWGREGR